MSNPKTTLAKAIFLSGAIEFGNFTLASGLKSPYYIDLSRLLSSPKNLETFVKAAGKVVNSKCQSARIDAVASIELRGALLLSALSAYIGRPCYVVRKTTKTYGVTGKIVGGEIRSGQKFILFDDVVTDGQSKLESILALEESGAKVMLVLVVLDREQGASQNLRRKGYPLESMLTVHQLVSELLASRLITAEMEATVTDYLKRESIDVNPASA